MDLEKTMTIYRNTQKSDFACNRLVYLRAPDEGGDARIQPTFEQTKEEREKINSLSVDDLKGLKETQEHETFGVIFQKMLEDKVQIQLWDDYARAEEDMRKYFGAPDAESTVPPEIRAFWFGGKDATGNTIQGVFEKIKMPKESPEFKEAEAAILAFRRVLISYHVESYKKMKDQEQHPVSEEPVLAKTKEAIGDIVAAFKEGDGLDKALMIGAAFMLYKAYDKFKDKPIPPTNITLGDAIMYGGAYWAANFVSLKVTGESLPEHLGIADPKKDLNGEEYQKFAQTFNINEGEDLDVMLRMGSLKAADLYNLYLENKDLTEPTIDPMAAGLYDTPLGDAKRYKELGNRIFNIMDAVVRKAGGQEEFDRRYIKGTVNGNKPTWDFGSVAWDLWRLESLKQGVSFVDAGMAKIGVNVLGRRRIPLDAAKLQNEFPWPLDWQTGFANKFEDEAGQAQGDGKTEVVINGVAFSVERSLEQDNSNRRSGKKLVNYKFTIKGSTNTQDSYKVEIDSEGKIKPQDAQMLEKLMEKNVKERLNRNAFFNGRAISQDIKWVKEKGWVLESVNLPAIPQWGLKAVTGDIIVRSLADGKLTMFVTGLGANIDLYEQAEKEGYNEHRIKTAILAQDDFRGLSILYPYIAVTIGLPTTLVPPMVPGQSQFEFNIGKSKLAIFYNQTTEKYQIAGLNPAQAEKAFVTDPEVAKILADIQLKDEEFKKVFDNMKDVFTAMPESFFKAFGIGFVDMFRNFNLGDPFGSISGEMVSGSIPQQLAYEMAEYKMQETSLRFREALKGAKTIKDIEVIRTRIVTETIESIKAETQKIKLVCLERAAQKKDFSPEEAMTYLNEYMATGYKSKYYTKAMLDFSKVAWEMDKQGLDKSDWNESSHKVHSHLMKVVLYHTLNASNNADLDDTNFTDYSIQKEEIERSFGYDHSKPATDDTNELAQSLFETDPAWIALNEKYKTAYNSFKQQCYLDYVISQVTYKTDVFGKDAATIDAVAQNLPSPASKSWEIIPESEYVVSKSPSTNNILRGGPKITDRVTVTRRLFANIDNVVTELSTPQYNYALLTAKANEIKRTGEIPLTDGVSIPLSDFIEKILAMPTRIEQEEVFKLFEQAVRSHLAVTSNEDYGKKGESAGYYLRLVWQKFKEFLGVV